MQLLKQFAKTNQTLDGAAENDFKDISFDSYTTIDPDHGRMKPENMLQFLKLIDT